MKHVLHVSEELNRATKQVIAPGDTAEFVEVPADEAGNEDAGSDSTASESSGS